jgi:hypothetical protein
MDDSKRLQMDSVVDRILRKKEVPDEEVFEAFWEVQEAADVRHYVRHRWFNGREVTENHITRKVNRFWPKVEEVLMRVRSRAGADKAVLKVFKVDNYKLYPSTMGYIAACSKEEALSKFNMVLPVFEREGSRYAEIHRILPQDEVEAEVLSRNAEATASVSERLSSCLANIASQQAKAEEYRLRMDAIGIFAAMMGTGEASDQADQSVEQSVDQAEEEVAF